MLSQKVNGGRRSHARRASTLSSARSSSLTREILEGVMATRAQPVKLLFQRMARIVRELAEETAKSVRCATEGETTEVDLGPSSSA